MEYDSNFLFLKIEAGKSDNYIYAQRRIRSVDGRSTFCYFLYFNTTVFLLNSTFFKYNRHQSIPVVKLVSEF